MDVRLDGKTAIVTGSGRGIGEEIAYEFAAAGATVVVTARTESEIEATAETIREQGGSGRAVPADLTDMADIDSLLDETLDAYGTPDILVNNAGVLFTHDFTDHSDVTDHLDEIDTMLDVNVRSVFLLSQRYAEVFRESSLGSGRIINVSSILGHVGVNGRGIYSGTKSGLHGLTRSLAVELASDDITVNSVSPGLVAVDRIEDVLEDEPERFNIEDIPAGRLGTPSDIAYTCLFLASDRSEYVTGQDILVDGGAAITSSLYNT